MLSWFKDRLSILQLTLRHAILLWVMAMLQTAFLLLPFLPPSSLRDTLLSIPIWVWVVGWLAALWLSTLNYSVERKKRFDETSLNFFRAYLDFLLQGGHNLFGLSGDKDFYFKVKEWQRQAVMGIAIGLGPKESERFFHKMEDQDPLEAAYQKSREKGDNELLSQALAARLTELDELRKSLAGKELEALPADPGAVSLVKRKEPSSQSLAISTQGIKKLPPSDEDASK